MKATTKKENEMIPKMVPINLIGPSPTNPRKYFNERELQELAASIKQVGVINPITVVKNGEKYTIVAGERRWRASVIAEQKEMQVIIRDLTPDQILEIQLIENLQRKDVHPMDEAHGFKQLLDSGKYDIQSLALKVAKTEHYVYSRLKLLDLTEPVQKSFLNDEIKLAHAVLLCRLQAEDQKKGLRYVTYEQWGNSKRTEVATPGGLKNWIDKDVLCDLHRVGFPKNELIKGCNSGVCTDCSKRTGFNKNLFPDLDKRDMCADPKCFNEKLSAWLKAKKEEVSAQAKDKSKTFLNLSSQWSSNKKDIIAEQDYKEVTSKNKCEFARKGIFVEGSIDKLGKVIEVCTEKTCKIHRSTHRNLKTPQEKEKERQEKLKTRIREETNHAVLSAILENLPYPHSLNEVQILGAWMVSQCGHDNRILLCKRHGWAPVEKKTSYGVDRDYHQAIKDQLKTITPTELFKLFIEITFLDQIKSSYYMEEDETKLRKAAKLYDVNVTAIEKSITQSIKDGSKKSKKTAA